MDEQIGYKQTGIPNNLHPAKYLYFVPRKNLNIQKNMKTVVKCKFIVCNIEFGEEFRELRKWGNMKAHLI